MHIFIIIYFINLNLYIKMKTKSLFMLTVALVLFLSACSKDSEKVVEDRRAVSQETLDKIAALGFSTKNVIKTDNGFLVEGDIELTAQELEEGLGGLDMRIASEEQYRTTNTITGLPRVITVSLASGLPSNFGPALDEALDRYNNEGLLITFNRVSSGGEIHISQGPFWWNFYGILGQAGFPTSSGNPHNAIQMNTSAFSNAGQGYLATVLAHEIGHCIGFRHTDYMDRSFSCGGAYSNEGQSDVGAIHIPGTPTEPNALSWMLACSDGSDRPFNSNDKVALDAMY